MNNVVTSKEEILKTSRDLIKEKGWQAISIRSVAAACNVSVGSIYNYFDSKSELVESAVESIWFEVFHRPEDGSVFNDTISCINWMFERMQYGCNLYPGLSTLHSLGFVQNEKQGGKQRMLQTWQHILNELVNVLTSDSKIRKDVFSESFTAEMFADTLFSLMLAALIRQEYDTTGVLEIVRRVLY